MVRLAKLIILFVHVIAVYWFCLLGGEVFVGLLGYCFEPGYSKSHIVTSGAVTLFYVVTMHIFWPDRFYPE